MPFETTWMQLETLILSEVSQKEKDKYGIVETESNLAKYKSQLKQLLEITAESGFSARVWRKTVETVG